MQKNFEILSKSALFAGINEYDFDALIKCLNGRIIKASKGEPVFLEGDSAQFVGVVCAGSVQVIREDYYGNRSVLAVFKQGELFGEAFSCAGIDKLPVSVIALSDSEVLLLDCRHVLKVCTNSCSFHNQLIQNLLKTMAQKNLVLAHKIRYMSQKTTKEKIMEYLMDQAKQQGSREFIIPYDRQALADYLGVERSAMSAEISRLKKSGQIDTKGSWFCLKQ